MKVLASAVVVAAVEAKIFFSETFDDKGWKDRWTVSEWKKTDGTHGKWDVKKMEGSTLEESKGLFTAEDSKFFGISTHFDSFSNKDKDIYIQFQMRHKQDIQCGGGYIKLGAKMDDPKTFGDPTQYNIMFGPDKCGGGSGRTHLIFRDKRPNAKEANVLKTEDVPGVSDSDPHVYTLHLKSDNTFTVHIDGNEKAKGSLKNDFKLLEPKQIKDPSQSKPKDWVEEAQIQDPEDEKPEDWVEEDQRRIKDESASKPEDWDDEEDGDWEAPMIDNPKYKGPWKAKMIDNPDYKGPWEHPMIDNPDYKDDDELYAYPDFSFLGFDLWQVKGGSHFDNIIITDDKAEAEAFAKKLEPVKEEVTAAKKKEEDALKKKAEEASKDDDDDDDDDPDGVGDDL